MNHYWSTYVQKTEELYQSRALKFHPGNMGRWAEVMQLRDGMEILEVGCAGGLLCHRIKAYFPNTKVTGIDFDLGHIEYARRKTQELGLCCDFVAGDATNLPFEENTFDVCCSHTVINFCDPAFFVKEQWRVLKSGGRMIIMCVLGNGRAEEWVPTEDCEEKELFDRLWTGASQNANSKIKRYEDRMEKYFAYLEQQGFRDISANVMSTIKYAPDCANVTREMALAQINEDRMSEISSAEKAHTMAPDVLTDGEYALLQDMIHRRWDRRVEQYERGEKTWEVRVATTVLISGTK